MASPFPPVPPLPWLPPPLASSPVTLPVGTVLAFAGVIERQATPLWAQGYLVCDGSSLPVSQFNELFLAIGYQYSSSDDGGTFLLPDLRGYFLRGLDTRAKDDRDNHDPDNDVRKLPSGALGPQVGSAQTCALQRHEHSYMPAAPSGATTAGDSGMIGAGTAATTDVVQGNGLHAPLTSERETRPANIAVHYIIKYTNAVLPSHLTALRNGADGAR